jgi:hypothetical protein
MNVGEEASGEVWGEGGRIVRLNKERRVTAIQAETEKE